MKMLAPVEEMKPVSWVSIHLEMFYFFFLRFYVFIHERQTERGRDTGRGRSRVHAGSPMRDKIPGPWGLTLSRSRSG